MKIFAIINNYYDGDHRSPFAIGKESTCEPDWYELPDSSVLRSGNPFFVPDFASEFQAFPSLVYRIGRLGKSIAPRFASRYVDAWTAGAAVTAIDLLSELRNAGAPWTRATAFDRSLFLGNLQPMDSLLKIDSLDLTAGDEKIVYRLPEINESIDCIISRISACNTLKNGDLILVGLTPTGLALHPGMRLSAHSKSDNLLDISIK